MSPGRIHSPHPAGAGCSSEGVWPISKRTAYQIATPPDALVAQLAAEQHGRVSFEQLHVCGLNATAIAVRTRRGHLHRVHGGVYAVGHEAPTLHADFMAAVLAGGEGAVLSHFSAAALWGMLPGSRGIAR